jgi:hypothetical protein
MSVKVNLKCEKCILLARCLTKIKFVYVGRISILTEDLQMDIADLRKCKYFSNDHNYKYFFLKQFFLRKKGVIK